MNQRAARIAALQGGLKAFLGECNEAELLTVMSWISGQRARPALSIARTPSDYSRVALEHLRIAPDTSFVKLCGELRKTVHELPEDQLAILDAWVQERLRYRAR